MREQYRETLQDPNSEGYEEVQEEFFEEAQKIIQLPETKEDVLESIFNGMMEDVPEPELSDCVSTLEAFPDFRPMLLQAMYVDEALTILDQLSDFSPAAVLYGKTLERCLRDTLLPVMTKMIPDTKVMTKDLVNTELSRWTMGAFSTILSKEYCDNTKRILDFTTNPKTKLKKSNLPYYTLFDQMNAEQQKNGMISIM